MKYNIAIVGATGLVGRTMLQVLAERDFPLNKLMLFASERSAGQSIEYRGQNYPVAVLSQEALLGEDLDFALFSAGGEVSRRYIPIARRQGITAIDNSSAWRLAADVPLIVPEVNSQALTGHTGLIANPNCTTIQAVVPLKTLDDAFGLHRVAYTTYQSVSGSGYGGIAALEAGLAGKPHPDYPIADNCLPHIGKILVDGYTREEEKMVAETRKILGNPDLKVTATAVRVPVRHCHCVAINAEFCRPFELEEVFRVLASAPGVVLRVHYPLPTEVVGMDEVHVGRVRRDSSVANGLHLWTVADNIRKGAATNAIQIAELLVRNK